MCFYEKNMCPEIQPMGLYPESFMKKMDIFLSHTQFFSLFQIAHSRIKSNILQPTHIFFNIQEIINVQSF